MPNKPTDNKTGDSQDPALAQGEAPGTRHQAGSFTTYLMESSQLPRHVGVTQVWKLKLRQSQTSWWARGLEGCLAVQLAFVCPTPVSHPPHCAA